MVDKDKYVYKIKEPNEKFKVIGESVDAYQVEGIFVTQKRNGKSERKYMKKWWHKDFCKEVK